MVEEMKYSCPKCGSKDVRTRDFLLRGMMGSAGILDGENVTMYICKGCKHIEFYSRS
jgi:predicted nucleic-acid-binding Zn-ribbon protein